MTAPARIGMIADGDAYFRMAVGAVLERQFGFTNIIETGSMDDALERLGEHPSIDLALFDPSTAGVRTHANLRTIRECFPKTKVAVISASSERRNILLALEAGVHGYVLKNSNVTGLVGALQTIFDGGIHVPPVLAEISCDTLNTYANNEPLARAGRAEVTSWQELEPASPLTSRQQEVLDLLVQGKTNKEIALSLGLGEGTVKIHMAAIFRYFGVNNRAAAAVAGARPYPNRRHNLIAAT
nr:response regulator transcription factor [Microvirga sp. ACRRW]